jgi:predicted short-subunit dehydrogenase-like oxidoreductase (DUF2520 family)
MFESVRVVGRGRVGTAVNERLELTGPIARGDWATVQARLAEIAGRAPELEEMYRVLATVTVG